MRSMMPAELNKSSKSPELGRQGLELQVECPSLSEENGLPVKGEATVLAAEAWLDVCYDRRVVDEVFPSLDNSWSFVKVRDCLDEDVFVDENVVTLLSQRGNKKGSFPERRDWAKLSSADCYFATIDGNVSHNSSKLFRTRDYDVVAQLQGVTRFGDFVWPFPVRCKKRQFYLFLRELEAFCDDPLTSEISRHSRSMLFKHGQLCGWMLEKFSYVWSIRYVENLEGLLLPPVLGNDVRNGAVSLWNDSRFFLWELLTSPCDFLIVYFVLCSSLLLMLLFVVSFADVAGLLFLILVQVFALQFVSVDDFSLLIAPVTEEVYKKCFDPSFLALVEMFVYLTAVKPCRKVYEYRAAAMMMHVFTSFLPLHDAIVVHFIWNAVIPKFYDYAYGSAALAVLDVVDETVGLSNVETFCSIMDILRKIYKRDKTGLLLSAGMNVTLLRRALEFLHMRDVQEIIDDFGVEWEPDEDQVTMLAEAWYTVFLPVYMHKSPLFKKTTTLVLALVASAANLNKDAFQKLSSFVDWDRVPDLDFLNIAVHGVKAVYAAVSRVATEGISALWDLPADVAFIEEASRLLYEDHPEDNVERVASKYEQAVDLIESRKYRVADPYISRLTDRLRAFALEKTVFLRENKRRAPPMVIFIGGVPGVGKTTLVDAYINMLCVLFGWERFVGDRIDYNVHLKFPAETGIHSRAKFLVLNDVPDDYSTFDMTDRISLDVLLQQVVDTCKFEIRSAAVEKKGMVLNDIEIVIVNSNYRSFVFPNNCEKLMRRIETGSCFWMEFRDPVTKLALEHDDIKDMSDQDRCTRVVCVPQVVRCKGKHMSFFPNDVKAKPMTFQQMIRHTLSQSDKHAAVRRKYEDKFLNEAVMCACGAPSVYHIGPDGYEPLTDLCPIVQVVESVPVEMLEDVDIDVLGNGSGRPAPRVPDPDVPNDHWNIHRERAHEMWSSFGPRRSPTLEAPSKMRWLWNGFVVAVSECFVFMRVLVPEWCYMAFAPIFSWFFRTRVGNWLLEKMPYVWALHVRAALAWTSVNGFVRDHKIFLSVIGAVSVVAIVARFFGRSAVSELGKPIFSKDVAPDSMHVATIKREVNFTPNTQRAWNKKTGMIYRVELETVGVGCPDLERMCMNQTYEAVLSFPGDSIDIKVFVISPEIVLINRHFLRKVPETCVFDITCMGVTSAFEYKDILHSRRECEMIGLRNWFMPYAAPLHKFLAKTVESALMVKNLATGVEAVAGPETWISPHEKRVFQGVVWRGDPDCVEGMCATPVLGSARSDWFIVGCVAYRRNATKETGAALVLQEDYEKMCASFSEPAIDACNVSLLGYGVIGDLSEKAELRNVCSPNLLACGTLRRGSSSFHTKFKKTRFYNDIMAKDLLSKPYCPPKKIAGLVDGEYKSAFLHQFSSIDAPDLSLDMEWEWAMDDYLEPFADTKVRMRPMELDEAIFGCPEMDIDRVDFKTSVGFAMKNLGCRNKYDLFEEAGDQLRLKQSFVDKVRETWTMWNRGEIEPFTVELAPKDEIRPEEKVDDNKIRLFSVLDFHKNAAMRMLLMPLIRYLMDLPEFSECYGGINAGSIQWTQLALRMKKFKYFIDMDFKNYDTRHKRAFKKFAKLMRKLSLMLGYTEEEADMVYYCIASLTVQVCIFMNDVFLKLKGMPSGVIVTLILNSVINSLLMRIVFRRLCPGLKFREHVAPATVGDDNASGVSAQVIDKFNMLTIEKEYVTLGYEVTGASKGKVEKHIPFDKLTFVKRKFIFDVRLNRYLAPLEWDSVIKPLCFEKVDVGTTSEQRLIDVAQMAQREAWLHGLERFNEMQELLTYLFGRHRMAHLLVLLSFEELEQEFMEGVFMTFDC